MTDRHIWFVLIGLLLVLTLAFVAGATVTGGQCAEDSATDDRHALYHINAELAAERPTAYVRGQLRAYLCRTGDAEFCGDPAGDADSVCVLVRETDRGTWTCRYFRPGRPHGPVPTPTLP